uniref:Uncharacterized protein n=1 Tax=Cyanothece sp. (strain PCC 7425 / ATCC 29141) TaxID=395961 RepID=B8HN38_CYAP4
MGVIDAATNQSLWRYASVLITDGINPSPVLWQVTLTSLDWSNAKPDVRIFSTLANSPKITGVANFLQWRLLKETG